ncbi:hypothetical protein PAMC26510_19935 [Caballeronia sordidicola]|uniref:Uncharacterized protein n=1 Tax=Caballeronia sordidicola TaxID=196367 RepID=A0A242MPD7_CABSO|nr:hypothetical protein AXG89_35660 [Burkholderia sp. PAMC 26561]OTP68462.1 hypothetical protein PAMC26577_34150 [Caballeronia sordidicola]OTP73061.1 hypothetical protein PAMC26510_19935 [Caballeronia sordidicola]
MKNKSLYQGNHASSIIDAEITHIRAVMFRCVRANADGAIFHAKYWQNRLITLRDSGLSRLQRDAVQSLLSGLREQI